MNEYIVPDHIIEKAAKALDARDFPDEGWEGEGCSPEWREWCRSRARASLESVYNDILALAQKENLNMSQPVNYTPRGYAIWADFTDRFGQPVVVVTSSVATEDCVWIQHYGQNVHLTVEQAQTVRDALGAWIASVTEHEPINSTQDHGDRIKANAQEGNHRGTDRGRRIVTAEWIARRREIEQAATDGPWVQEWDASDQWWTIHGQPNPAKGDERMVCPEVATLDHREDWTADADFIVDARTSLPLALDALEKVLKVVQEGYHADTCGSVLSQEDYPCGCWKSEITDAITEALTGGEHDG